MGCASTTANTQQTKNKNIERISTKSEMDIPLDVVPPSEQWS